MFLRRLVEALLVHHVLSEDVYGFKHVHLILVFLYHIYVPVTHIKQLLFKKVLLLLLYVTGPGQKIL